MAYPANAALSLTDARMRIYALEERMQSQERHIASLESRIRPNDSRIFDRLLRNEQEIASLKDSMNRLLEASAVCHRADSLEGELAELKRGLAEAGILAAWLSLSAADPFDGIISRLTRECGGNVADHGVVSISASNVFEGSTPRNAADLANDTTVFSSKNEANQWIEWDFKAVQIEPTHYSIRTNGGESGGVHLRHWVLEGRTGDERWTILDERRDDSQLNGRRRVATFDITNGLRVRVLRLRQTGLNHYGTHVLAFSAFEVFGSLFKKARLDWRSIRAGSLENEFAELKRELINRGVVPERFCFRSEGPFDGIISHLTRECGGNVADHGAVAISASSVFDDRYSPWNAADLADDAKIFKSQLERDQWIEWDFKAAQLEPTYYSVRTHPGESGGSHLRQWVLEGRTEEEHWTILDERRDDSQLNGRVRAATFEIVNRMRVRILRLRQTGLNHRGSHVLAFSAFEIFGSFYREHLRT